MCMPLLFVLFLCSLSLSFVGLCACVAVWVFVRMQSTVDKLIKKTNLALVVGSSSWREQFVNAVTVSAGNTRTDSHTHDFDGWILFFFVFFNVYCDYKTAIQMEEAGVCLNQRPLHRNGGSVFDTDNGDKRHVTYQSFRNNK